jgi:hypothetical protein
MLSHVFNYKNRTTGKSTMTGSIIIAESNVATLSIGGDKEINMHVLTPPMVHSHITVNSTGAWHRTYYSDRSICVPMQCLTLYAYWHEQLIYHRTDHKSRFTFDLTGAKIKVTGSQIYYCTCDDNLKCITTRQIRPCVPFELRSSTNGPHLHVDGVRYGFILHIRMIVALSMAQDPDSNY